MFIQRIRGIQTLLVATQAIFLSATFWLGYVVLTVGFSTFGCKLAWTGQVSAARSSTSR